MSIFAKYMKDKSGFFVNKLTVDSIEQVRIWRNQDFVRTQMEYNQLISKEEQENWFTTIHADSTFEYYVFGEGEKPVGLVHLAHIHATNKTAEVGLFIGEANYLGTGIPFRASFFILQRAFKDLGLDCVFAKVSKENQPAMDYNISLGFVLDKEVNAKFNTYRFDKSAYLNFLEKWFFLATNS